MKDYKLRIFSDFDGTITKNDIWTSSLIRFIDDKAKYQEICNELSSQKIGTRETIIRLLELVNNFSFEKFNSYLDEEKVDEHFKDFLDFCKKREYDFFIVSGGFDYYINHILKRENADVKYYSCNMIWDESKKKLSPGFIHTDEYCQLCETCKRNVLINNTNDLNNEISVFIGDGESDFCVSGFADIVFAKGKLASYCWKNNITYFEYQNFADIKNKIISLTGESKIKQRQEAKNRRRDVIMGG